MASSPSTKEAVAEYLAHCKSRRLAQNTIDSRKQSLGFLLRVAGNLPTKNVNHKQVDTMFSNNPDWSPGTFNNRLTHVKGFFKWCRARGYMHRDSDPAFGWDNAKVPNRDRLRIPQNEWPDLFEVCTDPIETIAVATGLFLFLRGSEQQLIQLKHIDWDNNLILIYRRKVKEWDWMPIPSELAPFLRDHLTWLAKQNPPHPDHYLIPTRYPAKNEPGVGRFIKHSGGINPNRPFTRPYDVVKRPLERLGYPVLGEGEHTLRRTGARAYFDSLSGNGYDGALRRVQSMLGHELSETTERYLGLNLDRQTRNEALAGKPMFPALLGQNAKIIPIRREM